MKKKLLAILFALILFGQIVARDKGPDFNFPKDVTSQANADLKQALSKGDGQLVVDALVRSSLAKSSISIELMSEIVEDIDRVARKESRADIRALLYHMEAMVLDSYRDNFTPIDRRDPHTMYRNDANVKDKYAMWSSLQFDAAIDSLVRLSLRDREQLLQHPITGYRNIIKSDELGARYVPTLYHFLCYHSDMITSSRLTEELHKQWEEAPGDLYATMFTKCDIIGNSYDKDKKHLELYKQYADHAESGLPLSYLSGDEYYGIFQEYVKRFPKSIYANSIRNKITYVERKWANVDYDGHLNSQASAHPDQAIVKVKVNVRNVNDVSVRLYRLPDDIDTKSWKDKELTLKDLTLHSTQELHIDGTVPFESKGEVSFAALPYGKYTILPIYKNNGKEVIPQTVDKGKQLAIYDLVSYNVAEAAANMESRDGKALSSVNRIIVVDDATGRPVAGATVSSKDWEVKTANDGTIDIPDNMGYSAFSYTISKGDDHYGPSTRFERNGSYPSNSYSVNVYTDLGIYRPGETMKWAAIAYHRSHDTRNVMPNKQVYITIRDANYKIVDQQTATTDAYGRAHGTFKIPTDRLLGQYSISIGLTEGSSSGSHKFQVSEYKTPTFYVEFPRNELAFQPDQPITVTGKAATYSGMPVANAEVKLKLTKSIWDWHCWWYSSRKDQNDIVCDTIVRTDAQGQFSVTFDDKLFFERSGSRYRPCYYMYTTHAQVTDGTGESQEATAGLHIGHKREIVFSNSFIDYQNLKPLKLPLIVNTTDTTQQSVTLNYRITGENTDTIRGTISSDDPTIDMTRLASGTYTVRVSFADEEDNHSTAYVTLYRKSDPKAPKPNLALWIPNDGYYIDEQNVAHITIGTSTSEAHIYYIATGRSKMLGSGWVTRNKTGMEEFTFKVPNKTDEVLTVTFMAYHHSRYFEEKVSMIVPSCQQTLKVTASSFRDKLVPGKPERWSFTLKDKSGKPQQAAVMLEMFDKALNSLSDNTWSFSPNYYRFNAVRTNNTRSPSNCSYRNFWQADGLDTDRMRYTTPFLYTYNRHLWQGCDNPFVEIRLLASGAVVEKRFNSSPRNAQMELAEEQAAESAEQPTVDQKKLDQVEMRMSDVKTALWEPLLTSDDQGNLTLEFDAPNFNTTWMVQAIAYTSGLASDIFRAEVLTQKPLMVKSSLPRFVRQGDVTRMSANLQNASDHTIAADALIEVFDPRTGQVYAQQTFKETIESTVTKPLMMSWTVPDTIPYVGFRVRAVGDDFGDGEQVMIPVLTATSPIIETNPFFIDANQSQYSFTMPDVPDNARVTLEYCDNPVWYCVTALPSIFSDNSHVATSIAHSLYALNVARGIANSQPIIAEAFKYWQENAKDSMLVSSLERNADLKIGTLIASPWLRTSERQTLQMQQLANYFDADKSRAEHERLVAALSSLQQPNGGFAWYIYPNCKSSLWSTGEVLELLGNLRQLGYQPTDDRLDQMIQRALTYYDNEYVTESKKKENKKRIFATYAYTRSLFDNEPMGKDARKLYNKTIKEMAKKWGKLDLSLTSKAFYAMTLKRGGKVKEAMRLTESLRQFAMTKPEIGMYWDQYRNERWFTPSQVAATSVILRAMNEVDPRTGELDQIRKWMLLSKRTTDWGGSSMAADAVQSLLYSGSQWLERSHSPSITIDGKEVRLDRFDSFIGYSRRDVEARTGSQFSIQRSGSSPAWGGIYWQYTLPMQDVKQASIEELSICKDFVVLDAAEHPTSSKAVHVGDKVRVSLIITCDQAMDYVMVTDERASCFEPVDKTSGYRYQEGIGHYRETRDSATNLFFNHLNKGTHVITYDVFATAPGTFSSGIATIQSQQAPEMTAHSAGQQLTVE